MEKQKINTIHTEQENISLIKIKIPPSLKPLPSNANGCCKGESKLPEVNHSLGSHLGYSVTQTYSAEYYRKKSLAVDVNVEQLVSVIQDVFDDKTMSNLASGFDRTLPSSMQTLACLRSVGSPIITSPSKKGEVDDETSRAHTRNRLSSSHGQSNSPKREDDARAMCTAHTRNRLRSSHSPKGNEDDSRSIRSTNTRNRFIPSHAHSNSPNGCEDSHGHNDDDSRSIQNTHNPNRFISSHGQSNSPKGRDEDARSINTSHTRVCSPQMHELLKTQRGDEDESASFATYHTSSQRKSRSTKHSKVSMKECSKFKIAFDDSRECEFMVPHEAKSSTETVLILDQKSNRNLQFLQKHNKKSSKSEKYQCSQSCDYDDSPRLSAKMDESAFNAKRTHQQKNGCLSSPNLNSENIHRDNHNLLIGTACQEKTREQSFPVQCPEKHVSVEGKAQTEQCSGVSLHTSRPHHSNFPKPFPQDSTPQKHKNSQVEGQRNEPSPATFLPSSPPPNFRKAKKVLGIDDSHSQKLKGNLCDKSLTKNTASTAPKARKVLGLDDEKNFLQRINMLGEVNEQSNKKGEGWKRNTFINLIKPMQTSQVHVK